MDNNTSNLLEAFRTQSAQKRLTEPKALSSGKIAPKKSVKRKVRNGLIKLYVNAILIICAVAIVFVAYRIAVLPQIFPAQQTSADQQVQTPVKTENNDYQGPATYASTFAYYWLSGDLEVAKGYLANGYEFPENVITPVPKEVEWSKIWQVNPISKNKANVVIQAAVKSKDDSEENSSSKVVYLSVPLLFDNGKYGVFDIPTYLPPPGKATYLEEAAPRAPLPAPEQEAINNRLKLFFDEYYGGEPEKIAVYFKDAKPRAVLRDAQLKNIVETRFELVSQDNLNKVVANVTVSANIDKVDMLQTFRVNMIKDGNIWMVEKTDPNLPIYIRVKQEN